MTGGKRRKSKKSSKKKSKKKSSKKKSRRKKSRKLTGGKKRKGSKKSSKKKSRKKSSKKKSRRKKSRKLTGGKKGETGKKKKRPAPAHAKVQAEVIKMIVAKEGIIFREAMKKLKSYVAKALGKEYVKGGDITWKDALEKTKAHMKK